MQKLLLGCLLTLCSGCGISLTTSGFKAGFFSTESHEENGSRVMVEEVHGITIQWLPYFTYHDLCWWK